jgi:hypothetical protein
MRPELSGQFLKTKIKGGLKMIKPVKNGLDFLRDRNWHPITRTREGALKYAEKIMPEYLRRCGFGAEICDCGDYYRINYGHK